MLGESEVENPLLVGTWIMTVAKQSMYSTPYLYLNRLGYAHAHVLGLSTHRCASNSTKSRENISIKNHYQVRDSMYRLSKSIIQDHRDARLRAETDNPKVLGNAK